MPKIIYTIQTSHKPTMYCLRIWNLCVTHLTYQNFCCIATTFHSLHTNTCIWWYLHTVHQKYASEKKSYASYKCQLPLQNTTWVYWSLHKLHSPTVFSMIHGNIFIPATGLYWYTSIASHYTYWPIPAHTVTTSCQNARLQYSVHSLSGNQITAVTHSIRRNSRKNSSSLIYFKFFHLSRHLSHFSNS
jgi:hypothetical protein